MSHFPNQGADFNHAAAEAVFETIMKMDDTEAQVFGAILSGAIIQRDLACYSSVISKALDGYYAERLVEVGKALIHNAVSKAANGGLPEAELAALDIIAKAGESSETYAEVARKRKRDLLTGQFVQDTRNINHDGGEALGPKQAELMGIAEPGVKLSKEQRAVFQRGYHEVAQMLSEYGDMPAADGVLHLHYSDGTTTMANPTVSPGKKDGLVTLAPPVARTITTDAGTIRTPGINPRKTLTKVELSVRPNIGTQAGAYHAALGGAGFPRAGAVSYDALGEGGLANAETWNPDNEGSFGSNWTKHVEGDDMAPANRAFRRLATGSRALEATLGNAAPAKLKIALKVGQHAGELGPEAQKVIGPTADRTAYRYRGIERKPDKRLLNSVRDVMTRPGLSGQQKHDLLFHGSDDDLGNWRASSPVAYLRSRLPETKLNTLQRMSGHIPPSEGIIIDKTGKVTTQAVGYGDDHYLPFNLKKLGSLRGGEYIRTRTWGGPTTEDIYTGLVGGAKSLAVVSHNGVYTLEFDNDLKGSRRFNDKAARMVTRYGQLLDAVKSEQVTTGGLAPSRLDELRAKAGERYDQDTEFDDYDRHLGDLITSEKRNPKLSNQQEGEAGVAFFGDVAGRLQSPDGHDMTAEELTNNFIDHKAADQYAQDSKIVADMDAAGMTVSGSRPSLAENKARLRAALDDPNPVIANQKLAAQMGMTRQYDNAIKRAADDNKAALKPLALDSQGYELALTALQEQFPYYIKSAKFHPWTQGGTNAKDTGYVKPKHNRPEKALSGYFDTDVTGKGKVLAHTTRNQNRGVHQGVLKYVPTDADKREAVRNRIGGRTVGARGVNLTDVSPEDAAVLSRQASMNLAMAIKSQPNFKGTAGVTAEQKLAIAGKDVQSNYGLIGALDQAHWLLSSTHAQLLQEQERIGQPAFALKLGKAVDQIKAQDLLDVPAAEEKAFRSGGLISGPRALSDRPTEDLALHGEDDHDFGHIGVEFDANRSPSTQQVLDRYNTDPRITKLVAEGVLPRTPIGQEFVTAATVATAKNAKDNAARITWDAADKKGVAHGTQPRKRSDINEDAEGILRAKQLQRRYQEASQRSDNLSSAGVAGPVDRIVIVDPNDHDAIQRLGVGGVSPTIDYTPEGRHVR